MQIQDPAVKTPQERAPISNEKSSRTEELLKIRKRRLEFPDARQQPISFTLKAEVGQKRSKLSPASRAPVEGLEKFPNTGQHTISHAAARQEQTNISQVSLAEAMSENGTAPCFEAWRSFLPYEKNTSKYFRNSGFVTVQNKGKTYEEVADKFLPKDWKEAVQVAMNHSGGTAWDKCAIVGNSGGLLLSRYGRMIDEHDMVLRINQAPTKGYEQYVGTRATHRLLNRAWTLGYAKSPVVNWKHRLQNVHTIEPGVALISSRTNTTNFQSLHLKMLDEGVDARVAPPPGLRANDTQGYACQLYSTVIGAVQPGAWQVLKLTRKAAQTPERMFKEYRRCIEEERAREMMNSTFPGGNTASSGLVAVGLMYHLCTSITLFGVGQPAKYKVPYQYYKLLETEREAGSSVHAFDVEQALFEALSKGGVITLCGVRGCHFRGGMVSIDPAIAGKVVASLGIPADHVPGNAQAYETEHLAVRDLRQKQQRPDSARNEAGKDAASSNARRNRDRRGRG
ncbi:hypothetical protein CYMTET_43328 [Cymbomonas tetramitiformis]|uniref:Uncharacterized protein n=1 Tax=Cymbomonas tetramitiformis TaxID=36881 RepID=A0AAE0F0N3_9CHLO|nr:hypothetical protein CYMTET_43328 [Cymbomonas tetramitiformis]